MKPQSSYAGVKALLYLNPMTGLIAAFRSACLGEPVQPASLVCSIVAGALIFVVGCAYFRRLETHFADLI